ncbi:MAG: hypothetical protein H8E17_09770 [Deltaproteobacteria bacterium]|nr:hypothetical protein [Deltaproteobacteria bacterium]
MSEKPTYEELEQRVRELELAEIGREKKEKALRESEEIARSLLNAPANVIALLDARGIILVAYEALAERFGRNVGKLTGNWRVIFRFEDSHAIDVNYLDYH